MRPEEEEEEEFVFILKEDVEDDRSGSKLGCSRIGKLILSY